MNDPVKTLDKETGDKVGFITFIIGEFARAYQMDRRQAYLYLKQYGGLAFIIECWWALHTDTPAQAVFEIQQICQLNGGML